MRSGIWAAVAAAVIICVGAVAPALAAPPPLSAYGALPAINHVSLSPDGSRLAFVGVSGEDRRLVLQTLEGQVLAGLNLGKLDVAGLTWAGNDDIVVVTSQTRSLPEIGLPKMTFFTAQSFSVSKKRIINLSGRVPNAYGMIFDMPVVRILDGKAYAYLRVLSNEGTPAFVLARVSIADGSAAIVDTTTTDGEGWLVDAEGQPGARSRYNSVGGGWGASLRRGRSGWPEVFQINALLDSPSLVSFSPDGDKIVIAVAGEKGSEFIAVGPDGAPAAALPEGQAYDGVVVDPATSRLIGATYTDDASRTVMIDPVAKAAWDKVMRTFKGQVVELESWTADWTKVAVRVEGPGNPGVHYLVDLANKRADIIGDDYPGVPPEAVAAMKPYRYKARDGLEIPGYLTLPVGRDPKGLPLIVLPHGGPAARDEQTFDWWAQALASRGYAVLQPNFRGSARVTAGLQVAGYGEWGRKMQTDLSDGVRALAAEGVIDPKRVCIAGASYGGYAALAGPTLDPGVYRCAVAVAPVSDLPRFLDWRADRSGEKSEAVRYWTRFWGASNGADPVLAQISPARQAAKADAPILLIHGKDDTTVPYQQSVLMADALKAAGKPVDLVTLAGEDHYLSGPATRQQMLEALVAFLLRHNPPE